MFDSLIEVQSSIIYAHILHKYNLQLSVYKRIVTLNVYMFDKVHLEK